MLDHVFVSVSDLYRSIEFYERALAPLGIRHVVDYDGANGPEGHPDLKGFGRAGRVFFWLRHGSADARAVHVGFVAKSEAEVDAFYAAAISADATDSVSSVSTRAISDSADGAPSPAALIVRAPSPARRARNSLRY